MNQKYVDDSMIAEIIESSKDQLGEMEAMLIDLEKAEDQAPILRRIKHIIHSMKGILGSFGFDFTGAACHQFEDFIEQMGSKKVTEDYLSKCFLFHDLIKDALDTDPKNGEEISVLKQRLISLGFSQATAHQIEVDHRVLIVETSNSLIKGLRQKLSSMDIQVSVCPDGYTALGRILREQFDSIISANNLQFLTGPQLFAVLQTIDDPHGKVPLTLMSSRNVDSAVPNCQVVTKDGKIFENVAKRYTEIISGQGTKQAASKMPKHIIFIDDDRFIHQLLEKSLGIHADIRAEFFFNEKDAHASIDNGCELLVLDYMLEDTSGQQVFDDLKEKMGPKMPPVVFLTGKSDPGIIEKLHASGALGVIAKPFRPKELVKELARLYGKVG